MALTLPVSEIVDKTGNPLLSAHESWGRVSLGEISDVINGFAFKSSQFSNSGGLPLVRIRDVGKNCAETNYIGEYDNRYLVESGDLLVGMDGDFNCARWRGPVALLNQRVCKIVINRSSYSERFLDFVLPGYLKAINDVTSSVTVKHLSSKTIQQIPLPLPPLEVQEQIADELAKQSSRLDEAVANLKRAKANLKRYKVSVLKAAVEGRLVETEAEIARREGRNYQTGEQLLQRILDSRRKEWKGKGKYKEPTTPDFRHLPALPDGWTVASLEQLTSAERPICYGILMPKEDVSDGVLYVKVKNLKGDKVDLASLQRTAHEIAAKYSRSSLKAGDLLLSIRGTYGRVAEVPSELDGGNITQDTARMVVSPLVDPIYIASFLRSDDAQSYLKSVARGVAVKGVNIADVRTTPVFVPSFAEQKRIAEEIERRFSLVEGVEDLVDVNLRRAECLRQSILASAFSGKLIEEGHVPSNGEREKVPANVRHFSRAVLSAEIVHQLHKEPTFGRVKHQKIFHLCEYITQLDSLQGEYKRKAAGPLDNKLIYANETELKKQQWYQVVSRQGKGRKYVPLEKAGSHQKYLERYWPERLDKLSDLIELMRTWTTERCEIFSTVYAAWNDLLIWGMDANDDAILSEILNRWNASKKRISREKWMAAIEWIERKGYAPVGYGRPTAEPEVSNV